VNSGFFTNDAGSTSEIFALTMVFVERIARALDVGSLLLACASFRELMSGCTRGITAGNGDLDWFLF
jgi:hypothetical protein